MNVAVLNASCAVIVIIFSSFHIAYHWQFSIAVWSTKKLFRRELEVGRADIVEKLKMIKNYCSLFVHSSKSCIAFEPPRHDMTQSLNNRHWFQWYAMSYSYGVRSVGWCVSEVVLFFSLLLLLYKKGTHTHTHRISSSSLNFFIFGEERDLSLLVLFLRTTYVFTHIRAQYTQLHGIPYCISVLVNRKEEKKNNAVSRRQTVTNINGPRKKYEYMWSKCVRTADMYRMVSIIWYRYRLTAFLLNCLKWEWRE